MTATSLKEIEVAPPSRKWQRYPAYKPSNTVGVPQSPEHWVAARVDRYIHEDRKIVHPQQLVGKDIFHYSIPIVQELNDGRFEQGDSVDSSKTLIKQQCLLVSKLNPRKNTIVVAYPRHCLTVCSGEFVPLVACGCDLRYLFYVYSSDVICQVLSGAVQSVTRSHQRVDPKIIRSIWWNWPPLDEQQAIAAFLDRETARIDELIAKKQRLIELLKEKRQAVISRAVTKGLNPTAPMKPSGIDWLGDIPEHWEMIRIGFVTSSQGGCTPSKESSAFWNGDIPWVTPKDMKSEVVSDSKDHVTDEALRKTGLKLIPPPVVLIVVRGMILAHTFPVALTQAPVTINQDMKALTPARRLDADFLSCLLRACSAAFFAIVEESGHGTRVLRTDLWSRQELPIPPLEEQKEIATFVARTTDRYDRLADKMKRAIELLCAYRSALITAAVTGQIDVRQERREAP